jgi:hypothetical protein
MAGVYVLRSPATGVLYGVVRTHLAGFLGAVPIGACHPPGIMRFVHLDPGDERRRDAGVVRV